MNILNEATDLTIYKKLVTLFTEFTENYPGTGAANIYRGLIEKGFKVIPKDAKLLSILDYAVKCGGPKAIQNILSFSFSDLPLPIRPIYKDKKNKQTVAFYEINGKINNKILCLLNFESPGKKGSWVDEEGNKVDILDLSVEEGK